MTGRVDHQGGREEEVAGVVGEERGTGKREKRATTQALRQLQETLRLGLCRPEVIRCTVANLAEAAWGGRGGAQVPRWCTRHMLYIVGTYPVPPSHPPPGAAASTCRNSHALSLSLSISPSFFFLSLSLQPGRLSSCLLQSYR